MATAILHTEAGPNLVVREGKLQTQWLATVKLILVSLKAAGDMTFRVEGVIHRKLKFGAHEASTVFGVAPKPATKMILGIAFVDKKILRIEMIHH